MNRPTPGGGLVYSTDSGRTCPACRHAIAACTCGSNAPISTTRDGVVKVGRESKGRAGKTVTVVRGLGLAPGALGALGKQLRAACGSGGTVKDGVLELQGDHVERVVEWLAAHGRTARRAGG